METLNNKSKQIKWGRILFYIAIALLPFPILQIYKNLLVSDLFILLSTLIVIFGINSQKHFINNLFRNHDFLIPTILFSIGFLLSLTNSFFMIESITAYAQIIFIFCLIYPLIKTLFNNKDNIENALVVLTIITSSLSFVIFIFILFTDPQYAKLPVLLLEKGWGGGRVSFGGIEPNITARIIIQTIPLHIIFVLVTDNKWLKSFNILFVFINIFVAIQTGSRSGLLTIVSILILLPLFFSKMDISYKFIVMLFIMGMSWIVFNIIVNSKFLYTLGRFRTIFSIYKSASSIQRVNLLERGVEYILNNPVIGVGLENSIYHIKEKIPVHNPLILSWMENGIAGFLGYLFIYLIVIYYVVKSYLVSFFNDKLLLGLSLLSISMVIGDMFMANSYKRVLWIPCLLFIHYYKILNNETIIIDSKN